MKARGILMSAPMVLALLDGRKTQTRRICKPQPHSVGDHFSTRSHGTLMIRRPGEEAWKPVPCPYGKPGDLLWVRETWAQPTSLDPGPVFYRADYPRCVPAKYENVPQDPDVIRWSPGIHMFRWMSRLTLRITDVRVERLQEISEPDALAEGVTMPELEREEFDASLCARCGGTLLYMSVANGGAHFDTDCTDCSTARDRYRHLWNFINGADSWAANPWVWVLCFDVIKANVDQVLREAA